MSGYCRLTVNRKSPNPPPSEVSEDCKPLSARTCLDMTKQHYCEHLIPTASSSVKANNHPALLTSDPFLPTISPFSSVLYFILQPAIAPYTHPLCFFGIGTTTLILPSECIIPNLQQQLNYVGERIALRGERKWIVSCCRSWCACEHWLSKHVWCKSFWSFPTSLSLARRSGSL